MQVVLIFVGITIFTLLLGKINNDKIKKEYFNLLDQLKKDPKNKELVEKVFLVGRDHYDGQTIKGLFKRREKYYVIKKDHHIREDIEKYVGKIKY